MVALRLIFGFLFAFFILSNSTVHAGQWDQREMESFLAGFFAAELRETHCPGAIVAIVKDGQIFLIRGFGYSDPVKKIPADPARDRFYVASVSKLFTATAVLQLYEQGRLRLDDDVNHYLKHNLIEDTYPQPVTLTHLLTHTSGIEDPFVLTGKPRRVLPPGVVISYSNYGLDRVGEVIESVSGQPFAEYVNRRVLQPLAMTHSTFLPQKGLVGEPIGWQYRDGAFAAQTWDFDRAIPSGSLSGTAADMAAFMIAHLQKGQYGEQRILKTETAELMQRRHAGNHPRIPGLGLTFWEWERNGLKGIEHGGDTTGFQSGLYLLPSENAGFFVSCNSQIRELPRRFLNAMVDHYYPRRNPPPQPTLHLSNSEIARYLGTYRWTRCPESSIGKIIAAGIEAKATPAASGFHLEFVFLPFKPADYLPVERSIFQSVSAPDDRVAFREEKNGTVSYMFLGPLAFEKLPWYETMAVQTGFGIGFMLAFLVTTLAIPIARWRRRRRGDRRAPAGRLLRLATWSSALLNLVFLSGLSVVLVRMMATGDFFHVPLSLKLLLVIPLLTTALTAALLFINAAAWRQPSVRPGVRIAYGFYALCAVAFIPYLVYWNMVGFNY